MRDVNIYFLGMDQADKKIKSARQVAHAYNPSVWEAKVGGQVKSRSLRLQWAMIMPLYSSLGDRVKLRLKKTNQENYMVWGNCFKNYNSQIWKNLH